MSSLKNPLTMFRFHFVLITLLFSLCCDKIAALEVTDLYQATVIVDSQDSKLRAQAIQRALQGVFLKVGGEKSVLTNNLLRQAQKKTSRYMSQYHYQRIDGQLSLVVSFNENKVNALFEQANLALWGSLRPQVLLWLIDEQGDSRTIIADNTNVIIPAAVNDFSVQRGLPIIMPLMDLADKEQVSVNELWFYTPDIIKQVSARYSADTVIVMRISDSSLVDTLSLTAEENAQLTEEQVLTASNIPCDLNCTQQEPASVKVLDWHVYTQDALYTQQYHGFDKVSLLEQGLSDITELIYQSYALLSSAEDDFIIEVKNVTSLTSDTQLFDFLQNLSAVKTVTLTKAQGTVRQFNVDLKGSKSSFLASLKLNNKLTQIIAPQTEQLLEQDDSNNMLDASYYGMKVIVLGKEDDDIPPQPTVTLPAANNTVDTEVSTLPITPVFYWEQG